MELFFDAFLFFWADLVLTNNKAFKTRNVRDVGLTGPGVNQGSQSGHSRKSSDTSQISVNSGPVKKNIMRSETLF